MWRYEIFSLTRGSKRQLTMNADRHCWLVCSLVVNLVFLCPDVDECAQGDLCRGGVCANAEGSYTCTKCKAGYRVSQDRQRCEGRSNSFYFLTLLLNTPIYYPVLQSVLLCVWFRYWWVPVSVYLCQWDLSKLRRLLHLWELPHRI